MKKEQTVTLRNSVAYQLLKIVFAIYFIISISITLGHMVMEYLSAKKMVKDELVLLQKTFEDGLSTSLFDMNDEQLNSIVDGMYNVPILVGIKIEPVNPDIPVTSIAIGSVIGPEGQQISINAKEKSRSSSDAASSLIDHSFTIYQPASLVKIGRGTLYSSKKIIFAKVKDGFIRIIIFAIIKTISLWCLFLWAAHGRLSQPLRQMAMEVSRLDLTNLEGIKINIRAKAGTELKILEESFNQMIQNSSRLTKSIMESEKKYRKIFENASEGLFQVSPSGGIISANPAMARMLGYADPDEMIRLVNDVSKQCYANPDDHADFTDMVKKEIRLTGFERQFKRKDGSIFWGVASGQSVKDSHDNLLYYEGSMVDTTGQKEKIKAEKARVAAEEASRSKSEFLANMSHEIRTPMNAIIGLAHLAQKTDLTPKQNDYLHKIEASGLSLLGIINDILDFSKIEANKLSIESIEFDLQAVLDNVVNLINIKAEEKGLELLFDVSRDVPLGLVGDPLRLGQILINLAGNSIKFTLNGQILIKVALLNEDPDKARARLQFSVSDSGIGMSQEQISKLFQSFSQADGSTTRQYGGTGLGLTISKQLVGMMGGEISVESVYGEGSTFTFTAEFGVQTQKPCITMIGPGELHGMRVLIVDDNEKSREILRDLMEEFHFKVSEVPSGEAAISELKTSSKNAPYDLVLMDWQMNGMDGIETAKRIKEDSGIAKIPAILMVTAFGREEVMSQAQTVGLDGFLIKPVNRSLLFDAIMDLFGRSNMPDQDIISRETTRINGIDSVCGARILLVEDNKINQQVATELLESAGLIVTVAGDGLEALAVLKDTDSVFDGILMDIQMPNMDGFETTRMIRKNPALSELPIIAMTANAMAGDREKCLDSGMNDHIPKPIEPDILFKTLIKWLPETAPRSPQHTNFADHKNKTDLPGHLNGIDMQTGLRRTGNNPGFYYKLLKDFLAGHGDDAERILDAFEKHDFDLALRLIHTLKGVAGGIGAISLYESSQKLELSLKENQTDIQNDLFSQLRKDLQHLVDGLTPHIKEPLNKSYADSAPVDNAAIDALLEKIRLMIEEMDPDAEENAGKLHQILKQNHIAGADLAETLLTQSGDFDFEAALITFNELKTILLSNMHDLQHETCEEA
ncbi:PAS domain-containing hybrid sensor histidine kinase/response regulator [Desulfobacula phenolica]|uniref:histidine kinase n=1 Tax=Desulfobacula phenolica TaxID=90732 RepID=A0A1H2FMZ7_9BACT|nr:response regulator [Desulfobacula phenolica]SDU08358.1 PAS domain S-box-containing protein [Desulfobacula phenolica]